MTLKEVLSRIQEEIPANPSRFKLLGDYVMLYWKCRSPEKYRIAYPRDIARVKGDRKVDKYDDTTVTLDGICYDRNFAMSRWDQKLERTYPESDLSSGDFISYSEAMIEAQIRAEYLVHPHTTNRSNRPGLQQILREGSEPYTPNDWSWGGSEVEQINPRTLNMDDLPASSTFNVTSINIRRSGLTARYQEQLNAYIDNVLTEYRETNTWPREEPTTQYGGIDPIT